MERIGVIGLSLTDAELASLERLGPRGDGTARELADALAASELVLLSTCNRVEVIYAREEGLPPVRTDTNVVVEVLGVDGLRFHAGRDAAEHLFRIAASLDSLVLGEAQILAQVRAAFERAQDEGLVGPLLAPLFEQAFRCGKEVRTKTDLGRHPVSVMSLGAQALAKRLAEVPAPRVALLGAGEAARHAAQALAAAGIGIMVVANRTLERAHALADAHDAYALSLGAFCDDPTPVDALVAATGAPEPLFDADELVALARRAPAGRGLIVLDLARPRDLALVPQGNGVERIDLDGLRAAAAENRARRAQAAAHAESLVAARLEVFEHKADACRIAAGIEAYVSEGEELLARELARLEAAELAGLGASERASVARWARGFFGRLTHLGTKTCKELARSAPFTREACDEEETVG